MQGSISAIIPTYNRSNFLFEAIDALLHQTRPLEQIIIWDDGSTDNTFDVVESIRASDHRELIQYFRGENRGKSHALNCAMKEVHGDYVWICDDDDVACLDAAEKMGHVLDNSSMDIVAGLHTRFYTVENSKEKRFFGTGYWPELSSGSVIRHLLEDIFFFQNASLVRRSCYQSVGPFREDLSRSIDYEMLVRLGTRFPIAILNDVLFHQRKHDGARGPSREQHAVEKSEEVWLKADQQIFLELRERLPISFYKSLFDTSDPVLALRAAYLQRGCVYARRCNWQRAQEDFELAAASAPDVGLTETEIGIVARAMAGKHGNSQAYSPPVRDQLLSLSQFGAAGRTIVKSLGRGSIWRAREALGIRDLALFARIFFFCMRTGVRPKPNLAAPSLSELDHLNREAYNWRPM